MNCVQETSVSAAVVLSVGLPRLVSRGWVVAAVLKEVLEVAMGALGAGVVEDRVGRVGGDVGASVVVVWKGVGRSLGVGRVQLWALASPTYPGAHS